MHHRWLRIVGWIAIDERSQHGPRTTAARVPRGRSMKMCDLHAHWNWDVDLASATFSPGVEHSFSTDVPVIPLD